MHGTDASKPRQDSEDKPRLRQAEVDNQRRNKRVESSLGRCLDGGSTPPISTKKAVFGLPFFVEITQQCSPSAALRSHASLLDSPLRISLTLRMAAGAASRQSSGCLFSVCVGGTGPLTLIIQTVRAQQEVHEANRHDAVLIPFGHNVIPHHNDFLERIADARK